MSLSYSHDGKNILAGVADGTVRLYNAEDGEEIAQFVGFTDQEWVSITPDGFYNASLKGDSRINVLTDSTVYGIDSYRSAFYKPQIVAARLAGDVDAGKGDGPSIQDAASLRPR
jgi:WD40 repeat protein